MVIGILTLARHAGMASLVRGAAWQFAALGAGLVLAVRPLGWLGQTLALALYAGIGALALRGLASHAPHRRFGAANAVTAARAAAVAFLLGVWARPRGRARRSRRRRGGGWPRSRRCALAADGIDGWLARQTGAGSNFGARFDMETDALLVLALALLVPSRGAGRARSCC